MLSTGHGVPTPSLAACPPQVGQSKWVIDENELLTSTWEHRFWTYGSMAIMGTLLWQVGAA